MSDVATEAVTPGAASATSPSLPVEPKLCARCRLRPRRRSGSLCKPCDAEAKREYRQERQAELERLRAFEAEWTGRLAETANKKPPARRRRRGWNLAAAK
jgi:hypothetical protein